MGEPSVSCLIVLFFRKFRAASDKNSPRVWRFSAAWAFSRVNTSGSIFRMVFRVVMMSVSPSLIYPGGPVRSINRLAYKSGSFGVKLCRIFLID